MGARLLPQSYRYPNLSEGADPVGGQLRGNKECPFSGVTKSGRVWRKVPESDARSAYLSLAQYGRRRLGRTLRIFFLSLVQINIFMPLSTKGDMKERKMPTEQKANTVVCPYLCWGFGGP